MIKRNREMIIKIPQVKIEASQDIWRPKFRKLTSNKKSNFNFILYFFKLFIYSKILLRIICQFQIQRYKVQMQIQNSLLRIEVSRLCKENAFLKIKTKMLEQRKSPSQVTIINKQLYLQYMQQVLNHKQKQLIDMQKRLQQKSYDLVQQQSQIKLLSPLENSTQIDIFLKKLQELKSLALNDFNDGFSFQVTQWKQFMKREDQIVQECKNYQKETQNLIKNQYENLIRQRKQLSENMDKFEELHSYEKYLNELQKILQAKQNQVLKKEDDLAKSQHTQIYETQRGGLSFGRQNRSMRQISQKKRLKIFESANKSQNAKFFNQYESEFSSNPSNPRFSETSQIHNMMIDNQSSFIMQESESNKNQTGKNDFTHEYIPQEVEIITQQVETQTNIETINQCLIRLQKQKKLLKFSQLWLKFSINNCKKTSSVILKKTFGLYLWRLNSVYDKSIPEKLKETFNWPIKYEQTLKDEQLFPYNELSLNRKKFAQLTLDFQKKILQKKKVKNALKYIILKKNVKERLTFVCYFKRYLQNAKLKTFWQYEKAIERNNNLSSKKNSAIQQNTKYNTESNLISGGSSRVMNENNPLHEKNRDTSRDGNRRSKPYLNSKSMSSTQFLNSTQQKSTKGQKQNFSPGESLDAKKLKEFIRTHEEAQKALATQCVKTQAICKFGQTLLGCFNKHLIFGFYEIKKFEEKERIIELEKKINKYEFKWQLFMTKCKLAIVNNNNKINHLEDTLSFMFGK